MSIKLILYSRNDCHLCSTMLEELHSMEQSSVLSVQVIDIDSDKELQNKYSNRIPVLLSLSDNSILCESKLNKKIVADYIEKHHH